MRLAFNFSSRKEHEIYVEPKHNDIHFHLEAGDSVYVGNSFDATVVVRSESEETREILVNLTAIMSFYTGVSAKKLKSYKLKFPLKSQEGKKKKKEFPVHVTVSPAFSAWPLKITSTSFAPKC